MQHCTYNLGTVTRCKILPIFKTSLLGLSTTKSLSSSKLCFIFPFGRKNGNLDIISEK